MLKHCIVCGLGSHREDWRNVDGEHVACDSHSQEDFQAAIAAGQGIPPLKSSYAQQGVGAIPSASVPAAVAPPIPSTPSTKPIVPTESFGSVSALELEQKAAAKPQPSAQAVESSQSKTPEAPATAQASGLENLSSKPAPSK